ncbi:MAG: inorganic phosphate transporter [Candidatus Hadarchaeales archaeon]
MPELLLLYGASLALAFYMAWGLGANDAANPCNCVVGAGVYSVRKALYTFVLFSTLGGILFGSFVMKTFDRGLIHREQFETGTLVLGSLCAALAGCLWVTFSTWMGMPVSTTHSVLGGVLGFALATGAPIRWSVAKKAFLSIPLSPLVAMVLAAALFFLLRRYFGRPRRKLSNLLLFSLLYLPLFLTLFLSLFLGILKWGWERSLYFTLLCSSLCLFPLLLWVREAEGVELSSKLLIIVHFLSAFAFGANDMANATGVFITPTERVVGLPTTSTMFFLSLMGAVGIALGAFSWGYKVIDTAGYKVCRLNPLTGLAAEYSQAFTVLVFTTIPALLWKFGIPISTSISNIGTVIGVGLAMGGIGAINRRTTIKILLFWILTIPCAALLSAGLFKLAKVVVA